MAGIWDYLKSVSSVVLNLIWEQYKSVIESISRLFS